MDRIERPVTPVIAVTEDSVWTHRNIWLALIVGALVGFALTTVMGTFGAAAGVTAGAAAVDTDRDHHARTDKARIETAPVDRTPAEAVERRDDRATRNRTPGATAPKQESRDREPVMPEQRETMAPAQARNDGDEDDVKAAGIGAALWLVLTAIVAGLAGGYVTGRIAHDASRDITLVGLGTWAIGIVLMVALMAMGTSSLAGGIGAGAGDQAAQRGVDAETGKAALTAASGALWAFFIGQVLGLITTIVGARMGMRRWIRRHRDETVVMTTPVSPAMP